MAGNESPVPRASQFPEGTGDLICLYSGLASFFFLGHTMLVSRTLDE